MSAASTLSSFLVVPVFALANAGVPLSGTLAAPGAGRLAGALGLALVLGKLLGVAGATWLGLRLRIGVLPEGMHPIHVLGVAATAGIGFTVSLFVVDLAYPAAPDLAAGAKIGILAASLAAAALGTLLLRRAPPSAARRARRPPPQHSVHLLHIRRKDDRRSLAVVTDGLWVDREQGTAGYGVRRLSLSAQEVAVLATLADARGRVVSRSELARRSGLQHASPRRADSLLVTLRRALGDTAVQTVRGRGWMLVTEVVDAD